MADLVIKAEGEASGIQTITKTVKELRAELKTLQNQAVGLSTLSTEYGKIASKADDVRRNLKSATDVGKTFSDSLTAKLSSVALGFVSISTAISTFKQQYADSVKYVKDHPYEFTVDTKAVIRASEIVKSEFDKSFAKSKWFEIFGAISTNPLAVLSGRAGGIAYSQAKSIATGVVEQESAFNEFLMLQAEDDRRSKLLQDVKGLPQWIGYSPFVSGDNPVGGSGGSAWDSSMFVGVPPQVQPPVGSSLPRQKSVFELQTELQGVDAMRAQMIQEVARPFTDAIAIGLLQGGKGFGKVMEQVAMQFLQQLISGGLLSILSGSPAGIFKTLGFAEGGWIPGYSPTSRSDNIPIWATAGEFVVNAESAARNRSLLEAINNRYADGGMVASVPTHNFVNNNSVDVYIGDRRLSRILDYEIRTTAKEINDRRGFS